MNITPQWANWHEQTLNRDQFRHAAHEWWPAHVLESLDPDDAYDICLHYEVDANFVINIFRHESSSGRAGAALETHSAGNTREPTFGRVAKDVVDLALQRQYQAFAGQPASAVYHHSALGTVPGRSGRFAVFEDWTAGWESTVARLASPIWVYHNKPTIFDVINTWAPGQDGNNPESYVSDVARGMNQLIALGTPSDEPPHVRLIDMFDHVPEIDTSQVLTASQINALPNFPRQKLRRFHYLTIHETDNTSAGADAQAHRDFVANGGGKNNVSYQWTCDDKAIIQITDVMEACWHGGDGNGPGNYESNAIEICVNQDGNYYKALYNAAYWAATMQTTYGVVLANKKQHNHWSGKHCPRRLRDRDLWTWFLRGVEDWRAKLDGTEPTAERMFKETGHTIRGRIRDFWERAESANVGYQGIGLPISAEYDYEHDGRAGVRQDFERASLFYEADKPFPWDVTALPVRVHHDGLVDSDLLRSTANALRGIVETLDEAVDE